MSAIKDVKVWKNPSKTETRIYVHTVDGREGCKYMTGNPWHPAKSVDGNLTDEEWSEAKQIAVWDKCWHTVYQNEIAGRRQRLDEEELADRDYARMMATTVPDRSRDYQMMETGKL